MTEPRNDLLRKSLAEFCNAFRNRGETTSLKVWNDRMKAAYDGAVLALGGFSAPSTDKLVERLRHEASLRAHYGDPILEEAADEIERLKAEVQEAKDIIQGLEEENARLQRCSWEGGAMTDLEMTKLCAEAMRYKTNDGGGVIVLSEYRLIYDPLRDDAQAMALVKKFYLEIVPPPLRALHRWKAVTGDAKAISGSADSLNRAIVECVAKMQRFK